MMDNRRKLGYVALIVVAVALFMGCGSRLKVTITRPSAINMKDFDAITIGTIGGADGYLFSTELKQAISNSDRFEVLIYEALVLQRMGSNEKEATPRRAALVTGGISIDYDEDHSLSTSERKNKKTGEVKIDTTYRTNGKATVSASLSIVDMHTSEVLAVKEFKKSSSKSKTNRSSYPSIERASLSKSAREKIIESFMRVIAPYTERVTVSFETDDSMPELEHGFQKAKIGDWTTAIDLFRQATETYSNSALVHKAYYNLGLGYLYTDQFESAKTALKKAHAGKAEKKYKEAIEKLEERIEDNRRLAEQGLIDTSVTGETSAAATEVVIEPSERREEASEEQGLIYASVTGGTTSLPSAGTEAMTTEPSECREETSADLEDNISVPETEDLAQARNGQTGGSRSAGVGQPRQGDHLEEAGAVDVGTAAPEGWCTEEQTEHLSFQLEENGKTASICEQEGVLTYSFGHLEGEPELRYSGKEVASFSFLGTVVGFALVNARSWPWKEDSREAEELLIREMEELAGSTTTNGFIVLNGQTAFTSSVSYIFRSGGWEYAMSATWGRPISFWNLHSITVRSPDGQVYTLR